MSEVIDDAALSVGFLIDPGEAFSGLRQIQELMQSTEYKVVQEAKRIEQATSGMIKPANAIAGIQAIGTAQSRESANLIRDSHRAEKAAEGMIRQLERQTETFGKSASEIRRMRAETKALAAENAGLTEVAGRLRAASAEMDRLEASTGGVGAAAGRSRGTMMQFGMQMNDVATMAALGAPPMQIFASQIGQIVQVAQGAEGGVRGFAGQLGGLLVRFAPLAIGAAAVGTAVSALSSHMEKDTGLKSYAAGLGLTKDEMKKLGDQSVTAGDMLNGLAATLGFSFSDVGSTIKGWIIDIGTFFGTVAKGIAASTYGLFVGTYRALVETWRQFPAVLGDVFVQAVNGAIGSMEWLINKAVDGINALGGNLDKVSFGRMENNFAGAGRAAGDAWSRNLNGAVKEGLGMVDGFMASWTANSVKAARDRLGKDAERIRADRNDKADKPKVDRHAEQLAREAQAIEAQIGNLFRLAEAYGVSSAAALLAEARLKAESEAIKKRGDVEAMVAQQVRLVVAQRVADTAKAAAGMRDQAAAQEAVNAMVTAGLVPAERANELVQQRMADLPALALIEAAQKTKDLAGAKALTEELERQRVARERVAVANRTAQFQSAEAAGRDKLAELQEELRLVGATDEARQMALATLRATQEAQKFNPEDRAAYIKQQQDIAQATIDLKDKQDAYNAALSATADQLAIIAEAGAGLADSLSQTFGRAGDAIGGALVTVTGYYERQARLQQEHEAAIRAAGKDQERIDRENLSFSLRSTQLQTDAMLGLTGAAKSLFKERSAGYRAMETAEKALMAVQVVRTAIDVAGGAARMFATLGPFAFPAVAAMLGVMASLGFSGGSGANRRPESNTGTGTVFGDSGAQSESITRAIERLREVDLTMLRYSREMAASLRSIEGQIGGVASLIVRAGDVNASAGVREGFKSNSPFLLLNQVPIIGGIIKSLFGTTTKVVGSGISAGPQSLGDILSSGFDADYFSDVQRKKKFLGINYSTKYRTEFADADPALENQFTLILRSFSDAIRAASAPLGSSTAEVVNRLNAMVISIGKVDLKDLSGEEIQEKLRAVFGKAADQMAGAAFPGIERFQKVGEGAFETLVRVASTVEAVTDAIGMLGDGARALSIDAKVALADQFDSIGDLTSATGAYFERFYSQQEQAAARSAQFARVFESLGMAMPSSLQAFRQLVEAQNLTTDAGQSTYATLLQLAPAFADLQEAMNGARSAADILAERSDLERKLLEVQGNTEALRALDLAKLDVSNRALQQQIWALQDAKEAAQAADELRKAWTDVGKSIMDEVKRIRGLSDTTGAKGFAALQGEFNAATAAARAGDQDMAKQLPGLSQALLKAAAEAATSRQELARVQAQTASSLEATFAAISGLTNISAPESSTDNLLAAMAASQATATAAANDDRERDMEALRAEIAAMRADMNASMATVAGNTGKSARILENVTAPTGGDAVNIAQAA